MLFSELQYNKTSIILSPQVLADGLKGCATCAIPVHVLRLSDRNVFDLVQIRGEINVI